MICWEYRVMTLFGAELSVERLDSWGAYGWELIGIRDTIDPSGIKKALLYFKRPLEDLTPEPSSVASPASRFTAAPPCIEPAA